MTMRYAIEQVVKQAAIYESTIQTDELAKFYHELATKFEELAHEVDEGFDT